MKSLGPATTDPTGAPSPLLRQNIRESQHFPYSPVPAPDATEALKIRDPSMWNRSDRFRHRPPIRRREERGNTVPPAALWLFSAQTRRTFGRAETGSLPMASSACVEVKTPLGVSIPIRETPVTCDIPGSSRRAMWEEQEARIRSFGRVQAATATRFPIVPDGTNRAASFAKREAESSSSAQTVGSSPRRESPTLARAIALRIPGVGRVTVSERRSTGSGMTRLRGEADPHGAWSLRRQLHQLPVVQRPPSGRIVQRLARHGHPPGCRLEIEGVVALVLPAVPEG